MMSLNTSAPSVPETTGQLITLIDFVMKQTRVKLSQCLLELQGCQKQILGDKALCANIESHAPFQILCMRGYAIMQHSDPAYLQ